MLPEMQDAKVNRYQRGKLVFIILEYILYPVFVILFYKIQFTSNLLSLLQSQIHYRFAVNSMFFMLFFILFAFFLFPLKYLQDFFWEHRFGLSNLSIKQWIIDEIKESLLAFALLAVILAAIYFLIYSIPRYWWLAMTFFWLLFSIFLSRVLPKVIIPLFFKFKELDASWIERLKSFVEQQGMPIKYIYCVFLSEKTNKPNAFITGWGKQMKLMISDNLLNNFSEDQIFSVVAHEIAHFKNRDIFRIISFSAIVSGLGFYIIHSFHLNYLIPRGVYLGSIEYMPVLVLLLIGVSLSLGPIQKAYIRFREKMADILALKIFNYPDAFISMLQKIGNLHLAEFSVPLWKKILFMDHPSLEERISIAESFK